MRDVRIDSNGELRCWNCGGRSFLAKRTGRAHIIGGLTVGFGALLTKKKLKCQVCGEYNQVGNAQPFQGLVGGKAPAQPGGQVMNVTLQAAAVPPAPSLPGPPAGWYPDPSGQPIQRWWDGDTWTNHTAGE